MRAWKQGIFALCAVSILLKNRPMPRTYYGTPTLHRFEDAEFYVPERTDEYLKHLYGADYMEIPPESKRRKGCTIYRTDKE